MPSGAGIKATLVCLGIRCFCLHVFTIQTRTEAAQGLGSFLLGIQRGKCGVCTIESVLELPFTGTETAQAEDVECCKYHLSLAV